MPHVRRCLNLKFKHVEICKACLEERLGHLKPTFPLRPSQIFHVPQGRQCVILKITLVEIRVIFDAIRQLMTPPEPEENPKRKIGFHAD